MTGTFTADSRESDSSSNTPDDEEQGANTDKLKVIVTAKTNQTIKGLRVAVRDGCVVLSGRTKRYYHKQLATEAVLGEGMPVDNTIEVVVDSPLLFS